MTAIMAVALMASTSVMAQDTTKKCCDSTKTECKKEGDKKACCKDKKSECKKESDKKTNSSSTNTKDKK